MPNICNHENCRNRAYFGYTNGSFERCREHKEDRPNALQICKCGKVIPNYNEPGKTKGICCMECKTETMVDVVHPKCSCGKSRPSYNEPGNKTPIYCKDCKTDTAIVVIKRNLCKCGKQEPTFNEPGETIPLFCLSCKTDTMINVKHRKCQCGKIPNFNEPGEKFGICCKDCKTDTMINVVAKLCISCGKCQPIFNEPDQIRKPKYCFSCKTNTMVNVVNKTCKSEHCSTRANDKYKGYCCFCFTHLFPEDPLTFQAQCKTKEIAVRDYINMNFEGFICDKQLQTGGCDCTVRRRPDLRILINETLLVIEVDENQHKSYSEMHEETRYNDLYMAYSGKWIYIRFNPDKFKKNNTNVNPSIAKRLPKLKEEIEKQFRRIENNENKELVERVYLYFDQ